MKAALDQVSLVPEIYNPGSGKKYPTHYRNSEAGGPNFLPHEIPKDAILHEVPIMKPFKTDQRPATKKQVEVTPGRKDRRRLVEQPPNDPGPIRAVVPVNRAEKKVYPMAGVTYHPEDNARGLVRAPMEPMTREGRQVMNRYNDDTASNYRVATWPPRDESGNDLTRYEERYVQDKPRKGRPVQSGQGQQIRGRGEHGKKAAH